MVANSLTRGLSSSCGECGAYAKDVAGQRFGKLVAVRPTNRRVQGSVVWHCQCDCGKTTEASLQALASKNRQSCGCIASLQLEGQRFGRLVAVKRIEAPMKGTSAWWECQCDCGNTKAVRAVSLNRGDTRSCGCLSFEVSSKDLTGQRFGKLVALNHTLKRLGGSVVWECQCDCGGFINYSSKNLQNGDAVSCGCARWPSLDLAGQAFGRLTALEPTDQRKNQSVVWKCLCSCGKESLTSADCLVNGKSRSCGCLGREVAATIGPKNLREESVRAYKTDRAYAARDSLVYLVEVAGIVDKIGIAFDLDRRSYKAEYTEVWWTKAMQRAECFAVEQVALDLTKDWMPENPYFGEGKSGHTEQRVGWVIEDVIDFLEELSKECKALGWEAFYDKHLGHA